MGVQEGIIFAYLATPKSAGASNVFVKTRPNTVVRAELIKNKTTKRSEPVSSVSRQKTTSIKLVRSQS